ncbi:hypothetical protein GpartN1_g6085.t1 [Galdieria partita]|uniref:Large ribosomal subunit protein uL29m n=1 Tax=Galdieria partita TaxID=83374 RepID=A0A9C7Q112_9RHOD|nr:hypothetical protein GpartN1_g6085.t1 [Galdieria partita]
MYKFRFVCGTLSTLYISKRTFSQYVRPWNNPEGIYAFVRREKELGSLPGREWTVDELRLKSFDDLHKLWWVMIKERNALLTERDWCRSVKREWNGETTLEKVNLSMTNIKQAVSEQKAFISGLIEIADLVEEEDEETKELIKQSVAVREEKERLRKEKEAEEGYRTPYRLSPRKQKYKLRALLQRTKLGH